MYEIVYTRYNQPPPLPIPQIEAGLPPPWPQTRVWCIRECKYLWLHTYLWFFAMWVMKILAADEVEAQSCAMLADNITTTTTLQTRVKTKGNTLIVLIGSEMMVLNFVLSESFWGHLPYYPLCKVYFRIAMISLKHRLSRWDGEKSIQWHPLLPVSVEL